MLILKATISVHFLLLTLLLGPSLSIATQPDNTNFSGKVKIQKPFSIHNSIETSSPLSNLLHCKSDTLYYKNSSGLFKVSSIDYNNKKITVSTTSLEIGFDPKDLNCSHYKRVYKDSAASFTSVKGFKEGTKISNDMQVHLPSICEECAKARGCCGIGLRCLCFPQECRDRVCCSRSGFFSPYDGAFFFLLVFTVNLLVLAC